ncbi:MAG: hypothetical protein A2X11_01915 [Bacteroidetes bacterium GWE2_42_24]|nr:MAG: hypothetical protein A2X11_01915 [Bacteroidetes bacterium GWE2_42_24]
MFLSSVHINRLTADPPPPPPEHSQSANQTSGGGAPIADGLFLTLGLSVAYVLRKQWVRKRLPEECGRQG